ncbi:Na+/H+ antiporter subunit G [Chromatiaceae bacterium AAb-1]|nr:Na+/H+ antiporter subunit G [Chromatiaceae bacterium AAb-1]
MNTLEQLSPWFAVPVIIFLIAGSSVTLIGALGLLRLSDFYQRIHGPAITITFGTGSILIASMIYFTGLQARPVVHELLITAFVFLTAPVTAMMIMRAAVYRDLRRQQRKNQKATPATEHTQPVTAQPPAAEQD